MTERPSSRLPDGVIAALLAAAAFIPFAITLGFGYAMDDVGNIERNPDLTHGWSSIIEVWKHPFGGHIVAEPAPYQPGLYRPLHMAVIAFVWNAGGHSPVWFHLMNIAAHAGATLLVWQLLSRCLDRWPAILAALWFAVHPLHVEVVTNSSNSSEVFVALWTSALALFIARVADAGIRVSWREAVIAGVLSLGAFFTKESGGTAPVLAAICAWGWRRPSDTPFTPAIRDAVARWWPILAACGAAAAVGFMARATVLGDPITQTSIAAGGLAELSAPQRVWAMIALGPKVLELLIWPTHNPVYGPSLLSGARSLWATITLIVIGLAVVAGERRARRGDRRILAAISWIFVAFVPASNVFVATGQIIAERTLYVSSIGMALLVGMAIEAGTVFARTQPAVLRRTAIVVMAMVIVALALRTTLFAGLWRNESLLFRQMIRADSTNYMAYLLSAEDTRYRGFRDEAFELFRKAYEFAPTNPSANMEYSRELSARGRYEEAAQVAAKLMDSPLNRADKRAVAFYLAALARAFGPESLAAAARRLGR